MLVQILVCHILQVFVGGRRLPEGVLVDDGRLTSSIEVEKSNMPTSRNARATLHSSNLHQHGIK